MATMLCFWALLHSILYTFFNQIHPLYYSNHPWNLYTLKPSLVLVPISHSVHLVTMTCWKIDEHCDMFVETQWAVCSISKPESSLTTEITPISSHIPVQTFKLCHSHFHHDFCRTLWPLTLCHLSVTAHLPTWEPLPFFNERTQESYQWCSECMQTAWQCSPNTCEPPASFIPLLCHP